jgi:hypothetical protein
VDEAEPRIRELLKACPRMPATVIAERIGWDRGLTVLKDRVRELRPAYLPPDPASRTAYAAGEIAQCNFWFPPVTVPAGPGQVRRPADLPVLTMVSAYSRWLMGVLVPTRRAEDLFAGRWQLISGLGAVPRALVWDKCCRQVTSSTTARPPRPVAAARRASGRRTAAHWSLNALGADWQCQVGRAELSRGGPWLQMRS